jgi:hypothetical protein
MEWHSFVENYFRGRGATNSSACGQWNHVFLTSSFQSSRVGFIRQNSKEGVSFHRARLSRSRLRVAWEFLPSTSPLSPCSHHLHSSPKPRNIRLSTSQSISLRIFDEAATPARSSGSQLPRDSGHIAPLLPDVPLSHTESNHPKGRPEA